MSDVSIIVSTNANEVGKEIKGLGGDILGVASQAKVLTDAMKFLDNALNKGKIDGEQYSKTIQKLDRAEDDLYASIGKTTSAIKHQESAIRNTTVSTNSAAAAAKNLANRQRMAGKSTNRFGMYTQQVGYQVGDFFVQVQSGTDALVAFGQQGTQLAGLLPGLAGAILGIGLAMGTAIGRGVLQAKNLTISFKRMGADLKEALGSATAPIQAIGDAFSYLGSAAYNTFKLIINNLDAVIAYSAAFATLLAGKLVYGFIASGKAAAAFFAIVRAGMIATGIGALVVGLGTLYLGFMRLIEGAGSFGDALKLLKDAASEVFGRISIAFGMIPKAIQAGSLAMAAFFLEKLSAMGGAFADFTWTVAEGLNSLFNTDLTGMSMIPFNKMRLTAYDLETSAKSASAELSTMAENLSAPLKSLNALVDAVKRAGDSSNIDPANWLVLDTDDVDGKGKTKSKLAELLEEQRQRGVLLKLFGAERQLKSEIYDITKSLGDEANNLSATQIEALAKVNLALTEQEALYNKNQDNLQSLADTMQSSMSDAFMSMVDGTKSFKDAMKDMAKSVIKQLYDILVVQRLVGSFDNKSGKGSGIVGAIMGAFQADGGAWSGGRQIQAYADGGVVGGPTYFPMSGGKTGLMGEAGPEAIMPLKRGKNGKLGVETSGSGSVVVNNNFNIAANGDESVKRIIQGEMPKISEATKRAVVDSKRRGGSYGRSF